jgi:hypothetical protein
VADPDQGLEGVGERDHLAGAADPAARDGGGEAVVEAVDQEGAERRGDPGVPGQQVGEAGGQHRPRLRLRQPRRAADRPAEQQVALVEALRVGVEADPGQVAGAGGDPVEGTAALQQGEQLGPAGGHPLQRGGVQRQALTLPGDRLDRLGGEVLMAAQGPRRVTGDCR